MEPIVRKPIIRTTEHPHYIPVDETKTTLRSNLPIKKRKLTLISLDEDVIGPKLQRHQTQQIHTSAIVKVLPRKLEMANQNSTPTMQQVSLPIKQETAKPNPTPAMVLRMQRKLEREKARDIPTTEMLRVMQRKLAKEERNEKTKEILTPAMMEVMRIKIERANEAKTKKSLRAK